MGQRVKITKERCKQCKYAMNMTGAYSLNKNHAAGITACGYILKTGESRVFKYGKHREKYDPAWCTCYEPGKRVDSIDSLTKNKTLKKGYKKND